jgi:hypothetical protein
LCSAAGQKLTSDNGGQPKVTQDQQQQQHVGPALLQPAGYLVSQQQVPQAILPEMAPQQQVQQQPPPQLMLQALQHLLLMQQQALPHELLPAATPCQQQAQQPQPEPASATGTAGVPEQQGAELDDLSSWSFEQASSPAAGCSHPHPACLDTCAKHVCTACGSMPV